MQCFSFTGGGGGYGGGGGGYGGGGGGGGGGYGGGGGKLYTMHIYISVYMRSNLTFLAFMKNCLYN